MTTITIEHLNGERSVAAARLQNIDQHKVRLMQQLDQATLERGAIEGELRVIDRLIAQVTPKEAPKETAPEGSQP